MQNNMQIWLESSTTTFNLNSHDEGVYLVSDLDGLTSLPEIRTSQGVNAGTDGGWTSAQAFDARLISLNIVIANEDESIVESKRRTLNSLLAQSRKESLKLHFISEAGMEYVISVRVTNVSGALSNILKKQNLLIQMRADDPIIYGAQGGEGADATLTVQQAQGGFEIPFDIPLIISGGTDKVNVENLGSEEVYPVIKMTGPLHNPTVVNETQNAEIGVNADLGDMEWRGYKSAEIYGNTTQETIAGKNLLNTNALNHTLPYTYTSRGIIFTIGTDGSITLNGQNDGTNNSTLFLYNSTTPLTVVGGQYTGDINPSDGVYRATSFICYDGSSYRSFRQNAVLSLAAGNQQMYVQVARGETTQFSNYKIYPMLEAGTTKSPYEPYVGSADGNITPSPNPDYPQAVNVVSGGQTVEIMGKNLFNRTTAYENSGLKWADGEPFAEAKSISSADYTPISAGQKVCLNYRAQICFYDISKVFLGALQNDGISIGKGGGGTFLSFTAPNITKIAFVRFGFRTGVNDSQDMNTKDIMVNLGATSEPYEPYIEQSYTIDLASAELCKIGAYQDYIWNDDGTWKVHKETGRATVSLGTTVYTITGGLKGATFGPSGKDNPGGASFCDKASKYGGDGAPYWNGCYYENPSNFMFVGGATDDAAALKAKYDGATLYYQLATPTDTEITDAELIGQLNALLDYAPWYGDDQNVFLIPSAGAQGELVLGAHNEPKPADVVLIDTQLKTVTLNGENAYPLLKDGSSFFTLAPGDNTMYLTSDVSSDTGKAEIKFKQGFISI